MKNSTILLFLFTLTSCQPSSKPSEFNESQTNDDETLEELSKNSDSVLLKASKMKEDIHPLDYFKNLDHQTALQLENSEDIKIGDAWNFTFHYPGSEVKAICAKSKEGESILFVWHPRERMYLPNEIQPTRVKGIIIEQINSSQFENEQSQSTPVYDISTNQVDSDAIEANNLINAKNISIVDQMLIITTLNDTLVYTNNYESTGGEGGVNEYYKYVRHIGTDFVLLAKPVYGGVDHVLINLKTSKQFEISGYHNIHNFHISPSLNYIVISYDKGGFDANYSPDAGLVVYDISKGVLELIYESEMGPLGETKIKWVTDNNFFFSSYCQSLSFQIKER